MSVTGTKKIPLPPTTRSKLEVFVSGSNADYTITVFKLDNDGVEHERSPANNTINGVSGLPLIISGKFSGVQITPPDGAAYTFTL